MYCHQYHLDNILKNNETCVVSILYFQTVLLCCKYISPCVDPVLIPTHTISRTTNSLDTITNRPAILTTSASAICFFLFVETESSGCKYCFRPHFVWTKSDPKSPKSHTKYKIHGVWALPLRREHCGDGRHPPGGINRPT